ncbi:hypothetical protein IQ06DRAFT_289269 [Phaeosphaeriaceae sp. SRC1lsM3a]|nr:hypothetical protein IQ06DRAFT_289269 [Stagonospora sp. SRC1lsM3a]
MTDEILVHISTPATRQNDDLYLSLAHAYLEFEPHNRIGYESRQEFEPDGTSSWSFQEPGASMIEVSQRSDPVRSSIVSTSKESYGSFPSLLSSDYSTKDSANALAEQDSVPTSSRLARLDRIHQHWKQSTASKSSFVGGPTSTGRAPQSSPDTTFIEDTQLGAQALQSQLQEEYSLTFEDASEEDEESTFLEEPQVPSSDALRSLVSEEVNGQTLLASREESSAAVATVSTSQPKPAYLDSTIESASSIMITSPKKQKLSTKESTSTQVYDFGTLPIDVYPPPPKISIERPGKLPSQVTKHFAAIKKQNPKRFKPVRKHDIPRADDRGYWSVPCSKWPSKAQHELWSSMSEHISSGRLGWGVTLHRDGSSQTFGSVRLYCWAELIEHTWLLLWLCSSGEIAKSGSKWMDAGGSVVYEVL